MDTKTGLASRIIETLHQRKSKAFTKLRYAPNFEKSKRFVLCWSSKCTPAQTMAIKSYIETLKSLGKQVIRIIYFDVKTKNETPLVPEANTYHVGKWDFDRTGFPQSEDLKNVLLFETDFFISLDMDSDWHFLGMASVSKAACKVGYYNHRHLKNFDLLIKPTENHNLNQYLCEIQQHLNKLA